jgi:hypothetical protein
MNQLIQDCPNSSAELSHCTFGIYSLYWYKSPLSVIRSMNHKHPNDNWTHDIYLTSMQSVGSATLSQYYTTAIQKAASVYFKQLMQKQGRAHACEAALRDSLPCKPSHNWPHTESWSVSWLIILPSTSFVQKSITNYVQWSTAKTYWV